MAAEMRRHHRDATAPLQVGLKLLSMSNASTTFNDQLLDYERRVEHVSSRDHYKKNILYVEVYQARNPHNEIRRRR